MKPVRCSWVDMQKLRAALSGGERGDQKSLQQMRCVDESTVSTWKATVDVMTAMDGKVEISQLSAFQPSHATELARHMRKTQGKDPGGWDADTVADWVDKCESEKFTVEQFREALAESREGVEERFNMVREWEAVGKWLLRRRESWPEEHRPEFAAFVSRVLDQLEEFASEDD